MHQYIKLILCLTAIIAHDAAHATKLSHKEYERFSGGALHADSNELLQVRDEAGDPYLSVLTHCTQTHPTNNTNSNMVRGLLNSYNGEIVHYIAQIPCNIISILQSDAGQAEQFVKQVEQGQIPTIISDLPQEAVDVFGDVLNVLEIIPSDVIDVGQAAVTDVVSIVNDIEDGSITTVVASLHSDLAASITDRWGDYNDGITGAWIGWQNGFKCDVLNHCPSSTPVQTCGTPLTSATIVTTTATATPTNSSPAAIISSSVSVASASLVSSSISALDTLTAGQQPSMQSVTQSPVSTSVQSTPQSSTQLSLASRDVEWAVVSLLGIAVVGILGVAVIL